VPIAAGTFGLDDYVAYVEEFIRHIGARQLHVISVCQPTVPVLAAVSLMAARGEGVTETGRHAAFAVTGDTLADDGGVVPGPHHLRVVGNGNAADHDAPGGGPDDTREAAQGGGLAGPVLAQDDKRLTAVDGEGNILQGAEGAEILAQPGGHDGHHSHVSRGPSRGRPGQHDRDAMITALPMAKNSSARTPRPAKATATPDATRTPPRSSGCRFCRASLRTSDNYCSHCGMPIDPVRDHPLFVVEGLSSLFNVVFFESLLEQELNRVSRYGHHLSVLVVEIDNLNELETAYGYDQINHLIRDVAEVMSRVIRDPDTLAATNRVTALGTHRFLVLLPETPEEGAFRTAEKIRSLVGSTVFKLGGIESSVTLSLGIASARPEHDEPNLLGRATQALIEGHGAGQNRSQVAPEGG